MQVFYFRTVTYIDERRKVSVFLKFYKISCQQTRIVPLLTEIYFSESAEEIRRAERKLSTRTPLLSSYCVPMIFTLCPAPVTKIPNAMLLAGFFFDAQL